MQNPTTPTASPTTAGCPSSTSTAPRRSRAACSIGSSRWSRAASALSWVVVPPYRSGARATNPSAAKRSAMATMCEVSPHHSWITTTPGPVPCGGSARYPWAGRPSGRPVGKVTSCRGPPWSGMAFPSWNGSGNGRSNGNAAAGERGRTRCQPIDSSERPLVSLMQKATKGMESSAKKA